MSGSQKTSDDANTSPTIVPNKGILPQHTIFLWNYVLSVGWGGVKPTDEIYTARLHWIKPRKVNPRLPIAIDPVNLGIQFNLCRHKDICFEVAEVSVPYSCPNFPSKKCYTIATCVLSPNEPTLRCEWYSYLIEGKGYYISEIYEILTHLEKYQIEFSRTHADTYTSSHEVETQTGIKDARQVLAIRMYPSLMYAFKNNLSQDEVFKALIIDHTNMYGYPPEFDGPSTFLRDADFVKALYECYSKKASTLDLVNLELVVGWLARGYYKMSDKQLLEAINKRTGSQFKDGRILAKRADRLGLTFIRSPGPDPKS